MTIEDAGMIVIDYTGKSILIVYQNESGKWGLPKGHLSSKYENKNLFACASRELMEETGIMLNMLKYEKLGSCKIRNGMYYIIRMKRQIPTHLRPIDRKEVGRLQWLSILDIVGFTQKAPCNVTLREIPQNIHFLNLFREEGLHSTVANEGKAYSEAY
jgi:ADP-ribose pyrophosphatase YjhB (NUDIX family)